MQQTNIKPVQDWVLARKIERDTGAVVGSDIRDTYQLYEIVAKGEGRMLQDGTIVPVPAEVGDTVWVEKHAAEGNTPKELEIKGLYLFLGARIMAIEQTEGN